MAAKHQVFSSIPENPKSNQNDAVGLLRYILHFVPIFHLHRKIVSGNLFFEKPKFRQKKRILKQSYSAKNVKWGPLEFSNIQFVDKYQEHLKGRHFGDI